MKRIGLLAAAVAVGALATAGVASARPHDNDRHEHHDNGRHAGWYKHHHRVVREVRVVRHVRHHVPVRTRTVYVYRSGQYLPRTYYTQQTYYVTPTTYNLRPPPPGYEWVRVGNNVYLTQTSNGLIADVVANLFR